MMLYCEDCLKASACPYLLSGSSIQRNLKILMLITGCDIDIIIQCLENTKIQSSVDCPVSSNEATAKYGA